jgi:hypothetical protein
MEDHMEPHTIGTIAGYKPQARPDVAGRMIDIRVRGIPGRVAKLPWDTTEVVVTADGMLFYCAKNGVIYPMIPDQSKRISEIVKECDEARKAPVTHIDAEDNLIDNLLASYDRMISTLTRQISVLVKESADIKRELKSIEAELVVLKADAAQEPSHGPADPIVAWSEPRSLRDGLAVPDNPFARRRP